MRDLSTRAVAALLTCTLLLGLAGCVYSYDDSSKHYDRSYIPASKDPLTLDTDVQTTIAELAIAEYNDGLQTDYDAQVAQYLDDLAAEEAAASAAAAASASAAAASASALSSSDSSAGTSSQNTSGKPGTASDAASGTVTSTASGSQESGSSESVSTYVSSDLTLPAEPDYLTTEDVNFYCYAGTYNGYIAVKYKIRGKTELTPHNKDTLVKDVIANYNFSYYPNSPTMALYRDGSLYTIREIYEAGGISEEDVKNIWYYFYIES